jgi:hypothetical protein
MAKVDCLLLNPQKSFAVCGIFFGIRVVNSQKTVLLTNRNSTEVYQTTGQKIVKTYWTLRSLILHHCSTALTISIRKPEVVFGNACCCLILKLVSEGSTNLCFERCPDVYTELARSD